MSRVVSVLSRSHTYSIRKPDFESTNYSDQPDQMSLDAFYLLIEERGVPISSFALYYKGERLKRSTFYEAIDSNDKIYLLSSNERILSAKLIIQFGDDHFNVIIKRPNKMTIWKLILKLIKLREIDTSKSRIITVFHKFNKVDYSRTLDTFDLQSEFKFFVKEKPNKKSYVYLKIHDEIAGQLFIIGCNPLSKISKLKRLACFKILYDVTYTTLVKNNVVLYDNERVEDCNAIAGDIIEIMRHKPAAGIKALFFNHLNEICQRKFDNEAPDWRAVKPGLSWTCMCENEACEAYNDYVIANSGFGVVNVAEDIWNLKCPACNHAISSTKVSNIGFYRTDWRIEGRLEHGEKIDKNGIAGSKKYTTFKDGITVTWWYLKIETLEED